MAVGAAARIDSRGEVGIWPDGAAFVEGGFVPIGEAKLPILDWGFIRCDCTYDVVHVWNGRFFRLRHHLERFEKSCAGLHLKNPHDRDETAAILHRLVRLTGLREAYVAMVCTRGRPPAGVRDLRQCRNRFLAYALPFVWIASPEKQRSGLSAVIASRARRLRTSAKGASSRLRMRA